MLRPIILVFSLLTSYIGLGQLNTVALTKDRLGFTTRFKLSLLNKNEAALDSIYIQNPFQDILECFVINDSSSIFVVYSSDGTNNITKGITLTFVYYKLVSGKAIIQNQDRLLWAANSKTRRFRYSYINGQLVFKDRKNETCCYAYNLNDLDNTSALVTKINTELSNSP